MKGGRENNAIFIKLRLKQAFCFLTKAPLCFVTLPNDDLGVSNSEPPSWQGDTVKVEEASFP